MSVEETVGPAVADPLPASPVRRLRFDLGARPFLVLFELTRACALACRHCRAESVPGRHPDELSRGEACAVLDDLASLGAPRPRVVLTGGDPLERPDLEEIVSHGSAAGLSISVSPAGTPRANPERLASLREAGAVAVSFSIDGASRAAHDDFRRVDGSFAWTLDGCRAAAAAGLRLQVNTTVCRETVLELPAVARLVSELGVAMWSVFFMVPVGRGRALRHLEADETEDVLHFLHELAVRMPLKTTEAPAYRRVTLESERAESTWRPGALYRQLSESLAASWPAPSPSAAGTVGGSERRRAPLSVGDGRGVVFVSHRGDVRPSGFLPIVAGNVRHTPLTRIYRSDPLLQSLRNPTAFGGRCGRCEFAELCGGSRAQAYGRTGDPLAEDGSCPYLPRS